MVYEGAIYAVAPQSAGLRRIADMFMVASTVTAVILIVLAIVFGRCPSCRMWQRRSVLASYCPYCGSALDKEVQP